MGPVPEVPGGDAMTRKLQLCAWCGESVHRQKRVTLRWDRLRGKPELVWHVHCAQDDFDLFEYRSAKQTDERIARLFLMVRLRGKGRAPE